MRRKIESQHIPTGLLITTHPSKLIHKRNNTLSLALHHLLSCHEEVQNENEMNNTRMNTLTSMDPNDTNIIWQRRHWNEDFITIHSNLVQQQWRNVSASTWSKGATSTQYASAIAYDNCKQHYKNMKCN